MIEVLYAHRRKVGYHWTMAGQHGDGSESPEVFDRFEVGAEPAVRKIDDRGPPPQNGVSCQHRPGGAVLVRQGEIVRQVKTGRVACMPGSEKNLESDSAEGNPFTMAQRFSSNALSGVYGTDGGPGGLMQLTGAGRMVQMVMGEQDELDLARSGEASKVLAVCRTGVDDDGFLEGFTAQYIGICSFQGHGPWIGGAPNPGQAAASVKSHESYPFDTGDFTAPVMGPFALNYDI